MALRYSLGTSQRYLLPLAVAGGIGLLHGCGQQTTDEMIAEIVADTTISDEQAIQRIAENAFYHVEQSSTSVDDGGQITLELVVRGRQDSNVTTFQEGDASRVDTNVELGMLCFQCRRLIEHGTARNLGDLDILLRQSALDAAGQQIWVDIFKFRLRRDKFSEFMQKASGMAAVRAPKEILHEVCDVEYDRFDQIRYEETRD